MTAHVFRERLRAVDPVLRTGRVRRIAATCVEADGPNVALGALCGVEGRGARSERGYLAEVIRVNHESIVLSPLEEGFATFSGAVVCAKASLDRVAVGPALLGRAI